MSQEEDDLVFAPGREHPGWAEMETVPAAAAHTAIA